MSTNIATLIEGLTESRNTIRSKLVNLGLAESTALLEDCATAIEGIANKGAVTVNVKEGETYTIPAGYHNGSGTVSGVAGGGNYSLQDTKTVTPTKSTQTVSADEGYYGLSSVTVQMIPDNYQDVSSVDATAADVLSPKKFVDSAGKVTVGSITTQTAVTKTLDTTETSVELPAGYYPAKSTVSITTETKTATPTKSSQTISASDDKVLKTVTVNPIPDAYQDVTKVTATAGTVLAGKSFVNSTGTLVAGTMADKSGVDVEITSGSPADAGDYGGEGIFKTTIPAGYYDGTSNAVVKFQTLDITPTKEAQNFAGTPAGDGVYYLVDVMPIPDAYQDVTGVTATAATVLKGSSFVNSAGATVAGTMVNNGAITKTIDGLTAMSVTIPAGYTTGGTVTLTGDIEAELAKI